MATRSELRALIKQVFRRTDKDAEINQAINDTLKEMGISAQPRKLQDQIYAPTVIGQEDYALPDNLLRIIHPIRILDTLQPSGSSGSYPMTFLTKDEYDWMEPNPNASVVQKGKPWAYTIFKNCVLLTDIPDKSTYQLEINRGGTTTDLLADVDEMIFTDDWRETVKSGALARLFDGMTLYQDATVWQSRYINGYVGDQGGFVGGLRLLRQTEKDTREAPYIVKPKMF